MKVYIAGPYTKGDVAANVRQAIKAGAEIIALGHSPFIPHLSHFVELHYPQQWQRWMDVDEEFLLVCDAVIRLPGDSVGADRETHIAMKNGIMVFDSVGAFAEEFCK